MKTHQPIGGLMQSYQQIDAEFAQYEAEAAALKQRMDALKERRKGMREQACNQALPEIVERMTSLGITLEQVRAALAAAKPAATIIHKYWNPETEETHSGKGTLPGWLVGKTGKGRSGDPRYLNPEWIAKEDAKEAAKNDAKKNKAKSSGDSVADQAAAFNATEATSNDAPAMENGGESSVIDGCASQTVANAPAIDVAHAASTVPVTATASNLN